MTPGQVALRSGVPFIVLWFFTHLVVVQNGKLSVLKKSQYQPIAPRAAQSAGCAGHEERDLRGPHSTRTAVCTSTSRETSVTSLHTFGDGSTRKVTVDDRDPGSHSGIYGTAAAQSLVTR